MNTVIEAVWGCLEEIDFPRDRMPKPTWANRVPKVLLALGGMAEGDDIQSIDAYSEENETIYGSRDIIDLLNKNWNEDIGRGSYDEVRRSCVKYLVEAGLVLKNPDDPNRATNSPASGYALSADFKELLLAYNTDAWSERLSQFILDNGSLRERLANPRELEMVAVTISDGERLELTPGKHNILQKQIVEEFLPRFTKSCVLIYLGDSNNRQLYYDEKLAEKLKLFELKHEQLPDIIAFDPKSNWLFFVEAVATSGHISELRKLELEALLVSINVPVVMVSAFSDRATMKKFLGDIAWETEVWIASDPSHLVHFNGDKFLGPYIES